MRTTRSQAHNEPTYSTEDDDDAHSDTANSSASQDSTGSDDAPLAEASSPHKVILLDIAKRAVSPIPCLLLCSCSVSMQGCMMLLCPDPSMHGVG